MRLPLDAGIVIALRRLTPTLSNLAETLVYLTEGGLASQNLALS